MENESAHYTASGSNNDIRAHDVIMDSGASNHFTGLKSMLKGVETIDPVMVKTVAGLRKVTEIGELQLTHAVSLKNVRHVEGNPFTLMSLAPIVDNAGKAVVFFKDRAITVDAAIMEHLVKKHEKESLFSFVRKGKLWVFPLKNAPSSESGVEVNMKSKSAQPNSKDQSQSAPPPPAAKGSSSNKKEVKFKPGQGKTKNSKRQSAPGGVKRRSASAAAVSDQQDESESDRDSASDDDQTPMDENDEDQELEHGHVATECAACALVEISALSSHHDHNAPRSSAVAVPVNEVDEDNEDEQKINIDDLPKEN
jgi:hypothetical protein